MRCATTLQAVDTHGSEQHDTSGSQQLTRDDARRDERQTEQDCLTLRSTTAASIDGRCVCSGGLPSSPSKERWNRVLAGARLRWRAAGTEGGAGGWD